MKCRAFTLIELLVVVAIMALLVAILIPSLGKARDRAKATVCLSQLKGLGVGLTVYSTENSGFVVPSFNMIGVSGEPSQPLDGWGPILDRDRVVIGSRDTGRNLFYCPNTVDIEGMAGGNTKDNPDKPRGWMDWPTIRQTSAVNTPTTIPLRGFDRIIRVSYWINAENAFGGADPIFNRYYTSGVGYGPTPTGAVAQLRKSTAFKRPSNLIALADGVYGGRQEDARLNGVDGVQNSRVGFRHASGKSANAAFADGHAEAVHYSKFPRAAGSLLNAEQSFLENSGDFTIYASGVP